jgi:hypothetical protein
LDFHDQHLDIVIAASIDLMYESLAQHAQLVRLVIELLIDHASQVVEEGHVGSGLVLRALRPINLLLLQQQMVQVGLRWGR